MAITSPLSAIAYRVYLRAKELGLGVDVSDPFLLTNP
jgi:hypothetical protein